MPSPWAMTNVFSYKISLLSQVGNIHLRLFKLMFQNWHKTLCISDWWEVTDGQVVRAGISVTWTVLSRSGGHEFEPWLIRTWGVWYFCPKSYLNQKYICRIWGDWICILIVAWSMNYLVYVSASSTLEKIKLIQVHLFTELFHRDIAWIFRANTKLVLVLRSGEKSLQNNSARITDMNFHIFRQSCN